MVVLFDFNAHLCQNGNHFRAQVIGAVNRIDGEVAALDFRAVRQVTLRVFAAGVGWQFFGIQMNEAVIRRILEAHGIEDEEFCFRTEIDGVCNTDRQRIFFSGFGNGTRIAVIRLAG